MRVLALDACRNANLSSKTSISRHQLEELLKTQACVSSQRRKPCCYVGLSKLTLTCSTPHLQIRLKAEHRRNSRGTQRTLSCSTNTLNEETYNIRVRTNQDTIRLLKLQRTYQLHLKPLLLSNSMDERSTNSTRRLPVRRQRHCTRRQNLTRTMAVKEGQRRAGR